MQEPNFYGQWWMSWQTGRMLEALQKRAAEVGRMHRVSCFMRRQGCTCLPARTAGGRGWNPVRQLDWAETQFVLTRWRELLEVAWPAESKVEEWESEWEQAEEQRRARDVAVRVWEAWVAVCERSTSSCGLPTCEHGDNTIEGVQPRCAAWLTTWRICARSSRPGARHTTSLLLSWGEREGWCWSSRIGAAHNAAEAAW
jgi:hypothetical protein